MSEVNTPYAQIAVPDSFDILLTDGIHEIEFHRGWFGTEGFFETWFIGQTLTAANGAQKIKVLDIHRTENDATVKVLVIDDPIPVAALIAILVTAGVIAALFQWSVSAVRKLADATSTTEIVGYNPDGTPILAKHNIFDSLADSARSFMILAIVGITAFVLVNLLGKRVSASHVASAALK